MKKYNKIDKYKDVVCNHLKVHSHYEFCLTKNEETKLRLRANDKKIFRVDGFNLDKAIIIWKLLAKGISVSKIAKEIQIHRKYIYLFINKYQKFSESVYANCKSDKKEKPEPHKIYKINLRKWLDDLIWNKIVFTKNKREKVFSNNKVFYDYYISANDHYLLNKNKKDYKIVAYKKSANEIIKDFKELNPNKSTPKKSVFYVSVINKHLKLKVNILPLKSLGKAKWTPVIKPPKNKKNTSWISIEQRPLELEKKLSKNDFELDTVHGKKRDKWILLSLMNRRSRFDQYLKVQRTAQALRDGLKFLMQRYNLKIATLTIDNGVENYKLDELGIKIFNCHAYASWEKGSIESAHRKIRKFLPKGKSFDNLSEQDIIDITQRVNNMPIKNPQFPDYMSPKEFEESIYF